MSERVPIRKKGKLSTTTEGSGCLEVLGVSMLVCMYTYMYTHTYVYVHVYI